MSVFANMLEISAKAQGCKIIADFPDVCFTPPQTPATPPGVPIPYPNFGMDSDLDSGTGTVFIGGKTVSQENSSYYTKISGDEAGCAPKKGVITSKNMGKAFAKMWSMDVKFEGKGVARFSDIATSNHASDVGDDPPTAIIGTPSPAPSPPESPKCPCCKGPAHENQLDSSGKLCEPVKEADYYDDRMKQADAKIQDIQAREMRSDPTLSKEAIAGSWKQYHQRREARKTISDARASPTPCPNLHSPPDEGCGKHFKGTRTYKQILKDSDPDKLAEIEASAASRYPADPAKAKELVHRDVENHVRKKILGFSDSAKTDVKKRDGKGAVNHKTPIQAGGCPVSLDNLISDGALSEDCKKLNKAQDFLQQTAYDS